MLNSHCNNNYRENKTFKKIMGSIDANPYRSKGFMDCKSTVLSTRLRNSMRKIDKIFAICDRS